MAGGPGAGPDSPGSPAAGLNQGQAGGASPRGHRKELRQNASPFSCCWPHGINPVTGTFTNNCLKVNC